MGKSLTGMRLVAALVLTAPLIVNAAGLGKLTVLSALGQALNAEIEIVSPQPGEEDSLAARLASGEAFRQANIEFNSVLSSVRFSIETRAGKPVVRMTSLEPVQEPFLDMLVELSWSAGRLVREYTFLLDPVEYKGPMAIAVAPAPVATPSAPSKPAPKIEERPIASAPAASAPAATPKASATKGGGTHEVKKGETLGKIAAAKKYDGVTLQQMLVALYRANRDAFIQDNINLVRAGRILNVPERETVASIDNAEARRLLAAQSANWNEYRRALGAAVSAAPAGTAPAPQAARGRITAQPEAPKADETRDQLRLSKADPAAKGGASARAAREDDKVARDKAVKESQSRIAELEKNVGDLNKLLEMKNRQLAQLEKQGAGKLAAAAPAAKEPAKPAAAPAPAAKTPEPPKPAAEPVKAAPAPVAKAAPEPAKPAAEPAKPAAEPAKPAETPLSAAKAPEAPKPAEPAKAVPAKPKAAAPPPPPPPGLMEEFIDDPIALGALGGVVLLLGGYGAWMWKRKKKAAESRFTDSVLGSTSSLGPPSVLGQPAPAEAAVEFGAIAEPVLDAAPAPAAAESDEVDPIAEADVYMAYGRDAQAEEILKEALAKNPGRSAIQLKLLEIYSGRKDTQSFEKMAGKLKDATGGQGAEWDKAMELGRAIAPDNPAYGGGAGSGGGREEAIDPDATLALGSAAAAPMVDFDIGGGAAQAEVPADVTQDVGTPPSESAEVALDFDLGGDTPPAEPEKTDFAPSGTLIIDPKEAAAASDGGLDFDLGDADATQVMKTAPEPAAPSAAADSTGGLDFDLSLDLGGAAAPSEPAAEPDLNSISFDLGSPDGEAAAPDAKWQEVATKLDLAKAYEEMGDKEGARSLLQEVMNDGDAAQKKQAEQMLSGLG